MSQGNANNAVQELWELSKDYLEATCTTIPPGVDQEHLEYKHPRTVGAAPDETSFHYGQRNFDLNNPPAIIYQLKPLTVWTRFNTTHGFRAIIEPKLDAQGNTMYEQWPEEGKAPRQLRDLPILPDQISTKEHWLYLECVRRIDPRVNFHDIAMRMHRNGRLATTSLQARGQNKREANAIPCTELRSFAEGQGTPETSLEVMRALLVLAGESEESAALLDFVPDVIVTPFTASGGPSANDSVEQTPAQSLEAARKFTDYTQAEFEVAEALLILAGEPVEFTEAEPGHRISWTTEKQAEDASQNELPSEEDDGPESGALANVKPRQSASILEEPSRKREECFHSTYVGPAYPKSLHDGECGCSYCQD